MLDRQIPKGNTWLLTPRKVHRSQAPFKPADVDLVAVNEQLGLEFLHRDRPFSAPRSTSTSTRLKVVTSSPSVTHSDLSFGVPRVV